MSTETNDESFRINMLDEIERMQKELNELKNLKKNLEKENKIVRKPAKKTSTRRKTVTKRKPAKKQKR